MICQFHRFTECLSCIEPTANQRVGGAFGRYRDAKIVAGRKCGWIGGFHRDQITCDAVIGENELALGFDIEGLAAWNHSQSRAFERGYRERLFEIDHCACFNGCERNDHENRQADR